MNEQTSFKILNAFDSIYGGLKNRQYDKEKMISEALHQHPSLVSAGIKIKMEDKQKNLFRLQNRPEFFSYGIANWEDGYIPFGNNFNFNIGVSMRYVIPYLGGRGYKIKMKQADLRMEKISYEKDQLFQDIQKAIEVAITELADNKEEVLNNDKIIMLARETMTNAWIKYQAGQGTIVDVLDAESILTENSISKNKSILGYFLTIARINYLIGNDTYPF